MALLLCALGAPAFADATEQGVQPQSPSRIETAGDLPVGVRVSEHLFGLPGLSNVGRVAPGIFRGAQPEPEGYRTLKSMGIRTVISLRAHHSAKEAVESAGMESVEIPIDMLKGVDPSVVDKVLMAMTDPARQPVYVHCAFGEDRTGTVVAVYRMAKNGWSYSEAEAEMQSFGFNDIWIQLKTYLRNYADEQGK